MARRLPLMISLAAGAAALASAPAALAGGCSSGCTPPPCCSVPTTHQVTVPGVTITPPSVSISTPSIAVAGASAEASASAVAVGAAGVQSSGTVFAVGGGGGFFVEQGTPGIIQGLNVEGEGKPVCLKWRAAETPVAVQAVCLDDKAVPHPASQVTPDRAIEGYEGEVYRCIAGTHMQWTTAPWAEHAAFDHGQSHACAKGDALYRTAQGELVCRPQKPARDCNERSLLRRYGAGIKLAKSAERVCVEWGSDTKTAAAGAMIVDGGVGGIVH